METREIKENVGLMRKTKKELVEIIYRKDDKEIALKESLAAITEECNNNSNSVDKLCNEVLNNRKTINSLRNYVIMFALIALIELVIILVWI